MQIGLTIQSEPDLVITTLSMARDPLLGDAEEFMVRRAGTMFGQPGARMVQAMTDNGHDMLSRYGMRDGKLIVHESDSAALRDSRILLAQGIADEPLLRAALAEILVVADAIDQALRKSEPVELSDPTALNLEA